MTGFDNKNMQNKASLDFTVNCTCCKDEFSLCGMRENLFICPKCNTYLRMPPRERIALLADDGSFREIYENIESVDTLNFPMYREKLEKAREVTGEKEAVVCGLAEIEGAECVLFVMDARFIMASLGRAVGENHRAFEYATLRNIPVVGLLPPAERECRRGFFPLCRWQSARSG